jgi:hypothetical protein
MFVLKDLNPNGMFELRGAKAIKISLADCPVQKHNVSTSTRTENSDVNGDPSSISIANGDRDSASGKEKEKEKGKNEEREKERDKSKSKVKENKKEKEKEARRKEKEKDRVRMEDGERVWENCFSVVWHDAARHFAVATQVRRSRHHRQRSCQDLFLSIPFQLLPDSHQHYYRFHLDRSVTESD